MRIHHLGIRIRARGAALAAPDARDDYLDRLARQLRGTDWLLLSYALSPERIQLGLLGGVAPLQSLVYPLHGAVGDRLEHVVGVAPAFASHLISFHHNEPVRDRSANTAWDSPWTSHRAYLRLAPRPAWLAAARGLALCGESDTARGRQRFDEMTLRRSLIRRDHWLSPELVGRVRRACYALSAQDDAAVPAALSPGDTRPESRPAALRGIAVPHPIAREAARALSSPVPAR